MAHKNNTKYDYLFSEKQKEKMRKEYLEGLSIREIADKYNIKANQWIRLKLLHGITRNFSEANKLAHKKYPERFRLSEEAKSKVREARLKFMKEHPEQTAWRLSKNNTSYPEKCFIKYLKDRGINKKYEIEREKSFFPYYADFAFNEIKLVVEIDGSQHEIENERQERDNKKDELIQSLGWKIIRYTEDTVKNDWNLIDKTLNLDNFRKIESGKRFGIFKKPKGYIKKERLDNGRTSAQNEASLKQRKVERPTKEKLLELVKKYSFRALGKEFGVSDRTISKWCKYYGLPYKKKELKSV